MSSSLTFQEVVMALDRFWAQRGCLIWQPYNHQVGAGTMNPATALRVLKASLYKEGREVLTGAKTSHGVMTNTKKESRGSSEKAAAEGGSGGGASERVVPRNFFLPRQYLRDGMPPERQMRFRKDNQIVTIAIESKGASTYQLRSWLHEFGADGKPVGRAGLAPGRDEAGGQGGV